MVLIVRFDEPDFSLEHAHPPVRHPHLVASARPALMVEQSVHNGVLHHVPAAGLGRLRGCGMRERQPSPMLRQSVEKTWSSLSVCREQAHDREGRNQMRSGFRNAEPDELTGRSRIGALGAKCCRLAAQRGQRRLASAACRSTYERVKRAASRRPQSTPCRSHARGIGDISAADVAERSRISAAVMVMRVRLKIGTAEASCRA